MSGSGVLAIGSCSGSLSSFNNLVIVTVDAVDAVDAISSSSLIFASNILLSTGSSSYTGWTPSSSVST